MTEKVAGIVRQCLFDVAVGLALAAFLLYNLPEWAA